MTSKMSLKHEASEEHFRFSLTGARILKAEGLTMVHVAKSELEVLYPKSGICLKRLKEVNLEFVIS